MLCYVQLLLKFYSPGWTNVYIIHAVRSLPGRLKSMHNTGSLHDHPCYGREDSFSTFGMLALCFNHLVTTEEFQPQSIVSIPRQLIPTKQSWLNLTDGWALTLLNPLVVGYLVVLFECGHVQSQRLYSEFW